MNSPDLSLPRLANPTLSRFAPLAAAAAGCLSVLAFAPFGLWPVQLMALALLFWLVAREASPRRGFLLGWAYGSGWIACGVYWLYISMHRYGGMPSWMAALAVALFALGLGLFTGAAVGSAVWLARRTGASRTLSLLAVFPSCWLLAEWLRGWVLTGFPWVATGYAHTASPLAGFAPLVGVYGIGGLAAVAGGALALLPGRKWPAVAAAALLAAGLGLQAIDWTQPNGKPVSVRLLQGNVPQEMKFAPEQISAILSLYDGMIRAQPADLIATPETALPMMAHQLPADFQTMLAGFTQQTGSHIALGIPVSDGPRSYANSMLGFSPTDARLYRYDKHHLVPFGEFIPTGFRWFVNMMNIPLGDFSQASVLQPAFRVKDQWVMPNICYEDLFGGEIARQIAASRTSGAPQPTLLLNLSNIAWFGDSIALPQHLQISQMRAMETGRPMLRATNTGATAVIDPKGKVSAMLPPYTRGALSAAVQGYAGWTPYVLAGNALAVAPALLLLAALWLRRNRRRQSSASD